MGVTTYATKNAETNIDLGYMGHRGAEAQSSALYKRFSVSLWREIGEGSRAVSSRAEEQIRADIVEVGRRLYARGFVGSNDGNISARLDDHRLVTTAKSVSKGFMTPDMMV